MTPAAEIAANWNAGEVLEHSGAPLLSDSTVANTQPAVKEPDPQSAPPYSAYEQEVAPNPNVYEQLYTTPPYMDFATGPTSGRQTTTTGQVTRDRTYSNRSRANRDERYEADVNRPSGPSRYNSGRTQGYARPTQNYQRQSSMSRRPVDVTPSQLDYGYGYSKQDPYYGSSRKSNWERKNELYGALGPYETSYAREAANFRGRYPSIPQRPQLQRSYTQEYVRDSRPNYSNQDVARNMPHNPQRKELYDRERSYRHVSFQSPSRSQSARQSPRPVREVQRETQAVYRASTIRYPTSSNQQQAPLQRARRYNPGDYNRGQDRGRLHSAWDEGGRRLRATSFANQYTWASPRAR